MRYIETLTKEAGNRLHATTKNALNRKVANSDFSRHKGYPDEVGFSPYILVDPGYENAGEFSENLCYDTTPERTTVFTAALGFPHLSTRPYAKGCFSIQKAVKPTGTDAHAVLDYEDETVQTVLHERERLRMQAIKDNRPYALKEDVSLTADPVDKILINAAWAAERRDGEITLDGIKTVIQFKRNNLEERLPFAVEDLTPELIRQRVKGKTCSPLIPQNEAQKTALLYYIDNPHAPISEVVEETGINRGRFETFRLNRPDPRCYNRDYIDALNFDADTIIQTLHEWLQASPHDVYSCADCQYWTYNQRGLKTHKNLRDDHKTTQIHDGERPTNSAASREHPTKTPETIEASTGEMLEQFTTINTPDTPNTPETESTTDPDPTPQHQNESEPTTEPDNPTTPTIATEPTELTPEMLNKLDNPLPTMADALGITEEKLHARLLSTLSNVEKDHLLDALTDARTADDSTTTPLEA